MIPSFLAGLGVRPELLAEHAGAYVDLASAEADVLARGLGRRALLVAAAGGCALLFVMLAGVAALLAAALPLAAMPAPWLLLAVPALPLLAALACTAALQRQAATPAFPNLREQLATDLRLVREAS